MAEIPTADARARLTNLRAELENLADTGRQSAQVVELDPSRVGRLSRVDALQAQAMAQAAARRRELLLRQIAAALRRIDNGDYGRCQACDEPIAAGRLEVDPTVLYCVQCAERAEK